MDHRHRHRRTVERLWAACQDRDWAAYAALVAPGVVCDIRQTRERVVGRDRWVRFNAEYPGDWRVEVHRVTADDDGATSWVSVHVGELEMTGISLFTFDDEGLVARIDDFWPTPYTPPPGREHLVERY